MWGYKLKFDALGQNESVDLEHTVRICNTQPYRLYIRNFPVAIISHHNFQHTGRLSKVDFGLLPTPCTDLVRGYGGQEEMSTTYPFEYSSLALPFADQSLRHRFEKTPLTSTGPR